MDPFQVRCKICYRDMPQEHYGKRFDWYQKTNAGNMLCCPRSMSLALVLRYSRPCSYDLINLMLFVGSGLPPFSSLQDNRHLHGVPPTTLVEAKHPAFCYWDHKERMKLGSFQEFVRHDMVSEDGPQVLSMTALAGIVPIACLLDRTLSLLLIC